MKVVVFSVGSAAGIAMSSYAPSPSMASSRDNTKRACALKVRVSGFEVERGEFLGVKLV